MGFRQSQKPGAKSGTDQDTDVGRKIPERNIQVSIAFGQIYIKQVCKNQAGSDGDKALDNADHDVDPLRPIGGKSDGKFQQGCHENGQQQHGRPGMQTDRPAPVAQQEGAADGESFRTANEQYGFGFSHDFFAVLLFEIEELGGLFEADTDE